VDPSTALLSVFGTFLVLALVAALYVVAAWAVAKRFGEFALIGAWLVGTISLATMYTMVWGYRRELAGVTISTSYRLMEFAAFLGLSAAGFGLSTLSVHRRRRRTSDGLNFGAMMAGVGAFFGGLGVVLVVVFVSDVFRLLG
jgi:hypothetical protein